MWKFRPIGETNSELAVNWSLIGSKHKRGSSNILLLLLFRYAEFVFDAVNLHLM